MFLFICSTFVPSFILLSLMAQLYHLSAGLINNFIRTRDQARPPEEAQQDKPIRIVLPFKDQRSADALRRNLNDLNKKIGSDLQPVFTSRKIMDDLKVVEAKPPLINQQAARLQCTKTVHCFKEMPHEAGLFTL